MMEENNCKGRNVACLASVNLRTLERVEDPD